MIPFKSLNYLRWLKTKEPDRELHHLLGSQGTLKLHDLLIIPVSREEHMQAEAHKEEYFFTYFPYSFNILTQYVAYLEKYVTQYEETLNKAKEEITEVMNFLNEDLEEMVESVFKVFNKKLPELDPFKDHSIADFFLSDIEELSDSIKDMVNRNLEQDSDFPALLMLYNKIRIIQSIIRKGLL